jgi:predicted ATPase/DNA-binding CsgD family transcriptional regulator
MGGQPEYRIDQRIEPLTLREREILTLLGEGLTSSEIAVRLTLAVSTTRWHIQQVYSKLGVNSKRQALERGREMGLIRPASNFPTGVPPASPGSGLRHNLPRQITRFYGRQDDIARVQRLLEDDALVTLTGPGGIGKTRLALQVAEVVLTAYPDGVWYCELAAVFDPALAPQQVAVSLGVRLVPNRPALDSLVDHLRPRQALLLLDNCEHLLEACAHLAELLLHACRGLKILAVSREPLGVMGEAIFRVPALPFPEPGISPDLNELGGYAAVSLFLDRAQLVQPEFIATSQNASHLARICQRLEGIPLALEMAAAWMTILSTGQLLERLDDSFRLLSVASHTTLPRHQTLRATIDWSYALLSETERLVLQRLSVFAGGCTLEAAEAVCGDENLGRAEVLEALAGLVDKSLVIADRQPGKETRYRLLQMVLQYAREKLGEGAACDQTHRRHRDFFLSFAGAHFKKLRTRERPAWIERCEAEHENLRQALEWSFSERGEAAGGLELIHGMEPLWSNHYPHEGCQWHLRGIAYYESHPELSREEYAWFLYGAGYFIFITDPVSGMQWVEKGIALSRSLGEDGVGALICNLMVAVSPYARILGDIQAASEAAAEARVLIEQVHGTTDYPERLAWMHDEIWYPVHQAAMLYLEAMISLVKGQYQQAIDLVNQTMEYLLQLGDLDRLMTVYNVLGEAYLGLGAFDRARESFEAGLECAEVLEDNRQFFLIHCLGWVALGEGNPTQASKYCLEGLRLAAATPDWNVTANCLELLAHILAQQGQPVRAATILGAAGSLYQRQQRRPRKSLSLDDLLPGRQGQADHTAIRRAYQAGLGMSAEEAVAFALR